MKTKGIIVSLILILAASLFFDAESFARAGGGSSIGSRGSRTYSPPPAPAQRPASPSQTSIQQTAPPSNPGMFGGGFGRSLMGGIMGGFLGGLLFRSLGFAGDGFGQGGGIGLFEIMLLAAIGYAVFWWIKKRQVLVYAPAGDVPPAWKTGHSDGHAAGYGALSGQEAPFAVPDPEEGLRRIALMDPQFNVESFKDLVTNHFFKTQIAWGKRDLSSISKLLTPEMNTIFEREISRLKIEKKINPIENISIRKVDTIEAWQEEGNDYITTLISANLLDYTKEDASGTIIAGSDTEPVSFNEYWTFTRPVGTGEWLLSAIQPAQS